MISALNRIRQRIGRTHASALINNGDNCIRVDAASLIELHRAAQGLPLKIGKISSRQSGNYLSPFKGRGMEFDEVRPYQPGDDIRTLDWRVTARTGKAHTKLFREERERSVLMWVDLRLPMFFATQGAFKSVIAARAAALLAWSAAHHGDRLGGLIFSDRQHHEMRPQRGRKAVLHFISRLANHSAWQKNTKDDAIRDHAGREAAIRLRRVSRPGSLIFLISDFRDIDSQAESHLGQIARHNDVVAIFIYDPLESELPPAGIYKVSSGEQEVTVNTFGQESRNSYHQQFLKRYEHVQGFCHRHGIYFLSCSTTQDLVGTLITGLGLKTSGKYVK